MKEVELFRIVHSDQTPECHMYLRERDGGRVFPIIIAANEMAEIHRKVHGIETRRPMTHDIFAALMRAAGAQLERVEITELKNEVFYAQMRFTGAGGQAFSLDARPSDAVAIATGVGARIFATQRILDEIGVREPDEEESAADAAGGARDGGDDADEATEPDDEDDTEDEEQQGAG